MNYAKGLHDARARSGLSKRQLALRSGLDPSYVAHLEAGRKKPSLDVLEKLAHVLGVPVPLLMLMSAEASDLRGVNMSEATEMAGHLLELLVES